MLKSRCVWVNMADGGPLDPVGSEADRFALMLHDRVVELERQVSSLRPSPLDRRVTVLGSRRQSDSGAVFVRARCAWSADLTAWAAGVLAALGARDDTRWDVWCCQHWSVGLGSQPYVIEALVERSGAGTPADVAGVAHAALDALLDLLRPHDLGHTASVEACAVASPSWFAESIRAAGATEAGGAATLHTWDPRAGAVVRQAVDRAHVAPGDAEYRAWTLLHGWLACQMEATEVWHPRALSACGLGQQLVSALSRVLPDIDFIS